MNIKLLLILLSELKWIKTDRTCFMQRLSTHKFSQQSSIHRLSFVKHDFKEVLKLESSGD